MKKYNIEMYKCVIFHNIFFTKSYFQNKLEDAHMVAIVTNTICDLTTEMAEEYGIYMIPDLVIFSENEQFKNNIEIDPPTFYKRLAECETLPTTSHPNIELHISTIKRAAENADEVLVLSPTNKMSGAYSTACTSRSMLIEQGFTTPITVYNSLQVSFGLGVVAREAAKLAKQNLSAAEIVEKLEEMRPKVGVYFALKTLDYARRGGRIGAIRCLAADLLKVKPILTFKDGLVKDLTIVRGFDKALARVIELYRERADYGKDVIIFHSDREDLAEDVKNQLLAMDPECKINICWIGCAIGVYTGAGSVGIAFLEKDR